MDWRERFFGKQPQQAKDTPNDGGVTDPTPVSELDQLREEVLQRTVEQRREVVGFWTRLLGSPTDQDIEGIDPVANMYRASSVRGLPNVSDEQVVAFSVAFAHALEEQTKRTVTDAFVEYHRVNPTFFENVYKVTVGFEYGFSPDDPNNLENQLASDAALKEAVRAARISNAERYFPPKTHTTISLNKATASVGGGQLQQLYPRPGDKLPSARK